MFSSSPFNADMRFICVIYSEKSSKICDFSRRVGFLEKKSFKSNIWQFVMFMESLKVFKVRLLWNFYLFCFKKCFFCLILHELEEKILFLQKRSLNRTTRRPSSPVHSIQSIQSINIIRITYRVNLYSLRTIISGR